MIRKYINKKGEQKIQGGPALKSSQVYPVPFGKKVAALHDKFLSTQDISVFSAAARFDKYVQAMFSNRCEVSKQ